MNKKQFEYLCEHGELFEMSYDEWLEDHLLTHCPNCGAEWDEIDIEYQICSICKYEWKSKEETK